MANEKKNQCLHRILWREIENELLRTFVLTTVIFGLPSYLYCVTATLNRLAND